MSSGIPTKFDTIDKTALTATAGSGLLAFYAFKGASEAKNTPSMIAQTAIGSFALVCSWGFASAWSSKKPAMTKQEYFSTAFSNVDQLQQNTLGKATSLAFSILYPQKKTGKEAFQDVVKKAVEGEMGSGSDSAIPTVSSFGDLPQAESDGDTGHLGASYMVVLSESGK